MSGIRRIRKRRGYALALVATGLRRKTRRLAPAESGDTPELVPRRIPIIPEGRII